MGKHFFGCTSNVLWSCCQRCWECLAVLALAVSSALVISSVGMLCCSLPWHCPPFLSCPAPRPFVGFLR